MISRSRKPKPHVSLAGAEVEPRRQLVAGASSSGGPIDDHHRSSTPPERNRSSRTNREIEPASPIWRNKNPAAIGKPSPSKSARPTAPTATPDARPFASSPIAGEDVCRRTDQATRIAALSSDEETDKPNDSDVDQQAQILVVENSIGRQEG